MVRSEFEDRYTKLLPELSVSDLSQSLTFWCDLLGFKVVYERPEKKFVYLHREGVSFMLEEINGNWSVGELKPPFGRGINFQIECSSVQLVIDDLESAGWPLFRGLEDAWYRADDIEVGCREFLVQDPDGYLLRFSEDLGDRPAESKS